MKAFFVSFYSLAATAISIGAIAALLITGDYLGWGGVLLTTVPFLGLAGRMMLLQDMPRTSARLHAISALAAAGVVLSFAGYTQGASLAAPFLAIVAWAGFIIYSYWYSSFGRKPSQRLVPGATLTEFELTDVSGKAIESSSWFDKPTIWIFFRGNWCPLCMAQIKELADNYRHLRTLGVRVALISPQPHENTLELARRFDVPFAFMTDEDNRAARALGIDQPHGLPMGMQVLGYDTETVLPTVIITDEGGRILWAHETDNYRVRPEPDVYLEVLREHGIGGA